MTDTGRTPPLPHDSPVSPDPEDTRTEGTATPVVAAGSEPTARSRRHDPAHTKIGRAWVGIAIGAVILVLLLIFILQNTDDAAIEFLGWNFTLPIGVALLLSAAAGMLIMALAGGARIVQLRHARTRDRRR